MQKLRVLALNYHNLPRFDFSFFAIWLIWSMTMNKLLWSIWASNTAFLSRTSIDLWQSLVSAALDSPLIPTRPPTQFRHDLPHNLRHDLRYRYLCFDIHWSFCHCNAKAYTHQWSNAAHPEFFLEEGRHVWRNWLFKLFRVVEDWFERSLYKHSLFLHSIGIMTKEMEATFGCDDLVQPPSWPGTWELR